MRFWGLVEGRRVEKSSSMWGFAARGVVNKMGFCDEFESWGR